MLGAAPEYHNLNLNSSRFLALGNASEAPHTACGTGNFGESIMCWLDLWAPIIFIERDGAICRR